MKHARIGWAGAIHTAVANGDHLRLADGTRLAEDEVVWLPPVVPGTIIALGINYADHKKELAKELTLSAKDEPLAFLKGPNALVGHRGRTRRPADATFMHYECELAVVIGRHAKRVKRADALAYVAGYTIANDYAIRDYLENWYRPNLRVKNRDGCTALGPWLVDATDVPDPHAWACAPRQRRTEAAGQHARPDRRRAGADRIPEQLHDAVAGRHHPHRHARGRGQRVDPATKWSARSMAWAG
jgi:5-oxopent-3-ene-1,2,5-tricarboxylate decarboxylase / 2-hydroxyhepta-2,4-diene-1,7-dioate isomerase